MNRGERIRIAMARIGLDQTSLAGKMNLTQPAISLIVNDKRESSKHLGRLATVLDVPLQWIVNGENPPDWLTSVKEMGGAEGPMTWLSRTIGNRKSRDFFRRELMAENAKKADPSIEIDVSFEIREIYYLLDAIDEFRERPENKINFPAACECLEIIKNRIVTRALVGKSIDKLKDRRRNRITRK
jgi:transcriptional regulator with XRE-family HTH domain